MSLYILNTIIIVYKCWYNSQYSILLPHINKFYMFIPEPPFMHHKNYSFQLDYDCESSEMFHALCYENIKNI